MRDWRPCVVLVALLCTGGRAQSNAPQGTPGSTIRATTELVLVPVQAQDGKGAHVSGLRASDFVIADDGHERTVDSVEELSAPSPDGSRPASPASITPATTTPARGTPASDYVVVVLDLINTPMADQARAKQQLLRFLEQRQEQRSATPIAMLTIGSRGLWLLHSPTPDVSVLKTVLAAVKPEYHAEGGGVRGDFPVPNYRDTPETVAADQQLYGIIRQRGLRAEVSALRYVAAWCARLPGRKLLVWASASFPFDAALGRALNRANVVAYPVDLRGGLTHFYDATVDTRAILEDQYADLSSSFTRMDLGDIDVIAQQTGGLACRKSNDLAACMRRAVSDSSAYYILSFHPAKDAKPGWHQLRVRVRRPGVAVRARLAYFVEPVAR